MSDEVKLPENLSVYLRAGEYVDNQQIAKLDLIFQRGIDQQAESAAKIAALEQQLAAMTADRNLWQEQHSGDCPNLARVAELERRCLIAEEAIGDACKWLDMAGTEHIVLQNTEHRLICDGKLPQIEVKP